MKFYIATSLSRAQDHNTIRNAKVAGSIPVSGNLFSVVYVLFSVYHQKLHKSCNQLYTERDSKIGFGLTRKLSRFDDRKWVNIKLIWTHLRSSKVEVT